MIAPSDLDPRLIAQLDDLASLNGAKIQTFRNLAEAAQAHAKLSITLKEEETLDSFLGEFKRLTPKPAEQPTAELARDGYIFTASFSGSPRTNRVSVTAATASGFHYALLRLEEVLRTRPTSLSRLVPPMKFFFMTRSGRNASAVLADFPSFPERGVVEGFYGTPWTHQDRLRVLCFEGRHGLNLYYYAPKDDPYHRKQWRDPYPLEEMARLGEVVETARANFVHFCFAVSPGLSMVYSSDEDFSALTSKLSSIGMLGVSCFALFLDDVPPELQSPEDQQRFKTLAQAHVYLINKLEAFLKGQSPANRLVVTPTTYTNDWGSRDYVRELGAGVNPDVPIVWTGTRVVSPSITASEAIDWGELLRRKPLLWDNFPVNDGIRWRLNLGPLRGRDPNLPAALQGFFSNPMNQARASLIPLQTVADYLWNSHRYDPRRSLRKAVIDQYGKDAPLLLAGFLKIYGDYWWDENVFEPLFVETRRPFTLRRIEAADARLKSSLASLRNRQRFHTLLRELAPFPTTTRKRRAQVAADPAFRHLPGQRLKWREDYDVLRASRVTVHLNLDGDFAPWHTAPVYVLNRADQIISGGKLWKGSDQISARLVLAWDRDHLYVAADVTDPDLYQPFTGRGIQKGDALILTLETAFRKNFEKRRYVGDEYRLLFSPGNFSRVPPSIFSDEDYLPPRARTHDYNREIRTAWKKTALGFSGDISIPVSFFDVGEFRVGYEIGVSLGIQKALPTGLGTEPESVARIVFTSKRDRLFPVVFSNPATYQRLVLK